MRILWKIFSLLSLLTQAQLQVGVAWSKYRKEAFTCGYQISKFALKPIKIYIMLSRRNFLTSYTMLVILLPVPKFV